MLYRCENFSDLEGLRVDSQYFALFTAFDLSQHPQQELSGIATGLVQRGLAYACCWGDDCERLHDSIDRASVDKIEAAGGDYSNVVMTTWHSKESLRKALWFFEYAAEPAEAYFTGCLDYVIATVPKFEGEVRLSMKRAKFDLAQGAEIG